MRIKKVTYKNEKVSIRFEKANSDSKLDEFSIVSHDKPVGPFIDALQALLPFVLKMVELPTSYKENMEVIGVAFTYAGELDVMGASILASKELEDSDSPFSIVTPHKPSKVDKANAKGEHQPVLTKACVNALMEVQHQAEQFISGQRLQLTLGLKEAREDNEPEEAIG